MLPLALALLAGCHIAKPDKPEAGTDFQAEDQHLSAYLGKPIPVSGTVLDGAGKALAGATVSFGGIQAITDLAGRFSLLPPMRGNDLLVITATGYRKEQIPLVTLLASDLTALRLDPIPLTPESGSTLRMLFGGDTAFGRRWLSPSQDTPRGIFPPDDPAALIKASDPGPGTRAALQWIQPHFQEADWRVLNLETPATNSLTTPHPTKEFCFFTLPGSIPPLKAMGVDYVSLGNNHVFDYLDRGLQDTLTHLGAAGITWSGAGSNAGEALKTFDVTLKGSPYSFFSACSIDGSENDYLPLYTAALNKAGCADLKDADAVKQTITTASLAGTVIAQLHFGYEYALAPSTKGRGYVKAAVAAGAKLVVCNHSHVSQGAGLVDQVPVLYCLGNLALDQDRLETFLGSLARVDMAGASVKAIRFIPLYLEDYRPRLVNGFLADYLVRRQAEFSDTNVLVFPYLGQGWIALNAAEAKATTRTVTRTITVPDSGELIVDLREHAQSWESLAEASLDATQSGISFQLGRDILVYGDFEDWDTDTDRFETARWDLKGSQRICLDAAWKGAVGLRLKRSASDASDAVSAFRERVRVEGDNVNLPNKDLSLVGRMRGQNAGPVRLVARYFASKGEREFGEESAYTRAPGTYEWEGFAVPLHMPPDTIPSNPAAETDEPHALRLFVRHSPGTAAESTADLDNLAVVSWQAGPVPGGRLTRRTPHALDFMKVRAPKGTYALTLAFESHRPAIVP